MRTLFTRILITSSLALAAACGGSVESQPTTQTAQSAVSKAPVAQSAHGFVKVAGDALGEVALRDEQRTQIEQLAAQAEARHQEGQQARKDLAEAIAVQIEAGKIDRSALQPKIDALVAAIQKSQPLDRAGLEKLHAILDANQRVDFVNALEQKFADMKGKHEGREHMMSWARDLKLTDDQKSQIKSIFMDARKNAREEHKDHVMAAPHEHGKKVLEAFKQDRFVMDEVAPARDLSAGAKKMTDHVLGVAEKVLPILTAEQRTIAAQKIRTSGEHLPF